MFDIVYQEAERLLSGEAEPRSDTSALQGDTLCCVPRKRVVWCSIPVPVVENSGPPPGPCYHQCTNGELTSESAQESGPEPPQCPSWVAPVLTSPRCPPQTTLGNGYWSRVYLSLGW